MMTIQKQDLRELFDPVRVDGRTFWRCRKCGKILIAISRGEHLKWKHSEVRLSGPIPTPDRIREAWISWYESGPHSIDLREKIESDLERITAVAVESEIKRIVGLTGHTITCPGCGHEWTRRSRTAGAVRCHHCGKRFQEDKI